MTEKELKILEGNIASIDHQNRRFTLSDQAGVIFIAIKYGERFDPYMRKQKAGYFEKPAVIMTSTDTAVLEDIQYTKRPPEWMRPHQQQSRQTFDKDRDQRIAFQGVLNAAIATYELDRLGSRAVDESGIRSILKIQKIYLKALQQYLEAGPEGITIPEDDV